MTRENLTLSLNGEDKQKLQNLAESCGYNKLSQFIRAIARGDLPLAHASETGKRIDKLSNRLTQLREQRDRDWEAIVELRKHL